MLPWLPSAVLIIALASNVGHMNKATISWAVKHCAHYFLA